MELVCASRKKNWASKSPKVSLILPSTIHKKVARGPTLYSHMKRVKSPQTIIQSSPFLALLMLFGFSTAAVTRTTVPEEVSHIHFLHTYVQQISKSLFKHVLCTFILSYCSQTEVVKNSRGIRISKLFGTEKCVSKRTWCDTSVHIFLEYSLNSVQGLVAFFLGRKLHWFFPIRKRSKMHLYLWNGCTILSA